MEEFLPWGNLILVVIAILVFYKKVITKEECEKNQASCGKLQQLRFSQGDKEFLGLAQAIGGMTVKIDSLIEGMHRLELSQATGRRQTDHHQDENG
jgi:hypothetical protein